MYWPIDEKWMQRRIINPKDAKLQGAILLYVYVQLNIKPKNIKFI